MLHTDYWRVLDPPTLCIHPDDQSFVDAHNALLLRDYPDEAKAHPHWIRTDRMAEPRLGPVDAPLVVLQLNPSFDDQQQDYLRQYQALLNPQSEHAGLRDPMNAWWPRKYRQLLELHSRERLQRQICSIEFFPYASSRFGHAHLRLPSQQYQFTLVREALKRGAVFIVTRGLALWCGAIPDLRGVLDTQVVRTINPQNACITPGNLERDGWDLINAVLLRSR